MAAKQAKTVLEGMKVENWPGVYVLGCIDRRVTIYSQQVRALNLAAALVASGRVKTGENVVVVGAGAAGLTCAAGLQRLGAKVTILERQDQILGLFRGGSTRWLHPRVYDWPQEGWDRDRAGLPLLDWRQGSVREVLTQLVSAWEIDGVGIDVQTSVDRIDIGKEGEKNRRVTWDKGPMHTCTVILAVGFGHEINQISETRYWETDGLDDRPTDGETRKWLVSGCGDGALTDLFRLCIEGFQHARMLHEFTQNSLMEEIRAKIRGIEEDPAIQDNPDALRNAYKGLEAPWVVEQMNARTRPYNDVTLVAPTKNFLSIIASPLNRFLAGQLSKAERFTFIQNRVSRVEPRESTFHVQYQDGRSAIFDRIQRRHGPKSALEVHFGEIAKALAPDLDYRRRKPTLTDQTRSPVWVKEAFGQEPEPFVNAYRRHLCEQVMEWESLGTVQRSAGSSPIRLADMYVPLRLGPGEGAVLDTNALLQRNRPLSIRGGPGSGKSTWMRQSFLALTQCEDVLPILISVHELNPIWSKESARYLDDLLGAWAEQWDPAWKEPFLAELRSTHGPRLFLMFDGWDELGDRREDVAERLKDFMHYNPRPPQVIVSSRPRASTSADSSFDDFSIQPLSLTEIGDFIDHYHRHAYLKPGHNIDDERERFTTMFAQNPGALEIARTPLLLLMLLRVDRDGELPRRRIDLYEKCLELLLQTHPKRRQELGALDASDAWRPAEHRACVRAAARLALHILNYGFSARASLPDAMSACAEADWSDDQRRGFLNWLTNSAGVLTIHGDDTLSFVHLAFQEYLCAWILQIETEGAEARTMLIMTHAFNDEWIEPLRLWAALVERDTPERLTELANTVLDDTSSYWLLGGWLASGLCTPVLAGWLTVLGDRLNNCDMSSFMACADAWRTSDQHDARRQLARQLTELADGSTWHEWLNLEAFWSTGAFEGQIATPGQPAKDVLSIRTLVDSLSEGQIARGRAWWSASPWWVRMKIPYGSGYGYGRALDGSWVGGCRTLSIAMG